MNMKKSDAKPEATDAERIAKRIARAGLGSRRDVERWIEEGRVKVNGQVLTSPAVTVTPRDRVEVDGQLLPAPEPTRMWRYYKPSGLVTTARDEKGRDTVFEHLPPEMPRVVSVGRLDLTTEGLLLLTNDGELARFLELPATGWARRYRVRVHGRVSPEALAKLAKGITVDGVRYGPIEATLEREQGSNAWLIVVIREGKNREVRRVMETLGLSVNRLIRTSYGPFQLGNLAEGEVEEIPRRILRDQLQNFFAERGDLEEMQKPPPRPGTPGPTRISPTRPVRAPRPRRTDEEGRFTPPRRQGYAQPSEQTGERPARPRRPEESERAAATPRTERPARRGREETAPAERPFRDRRNAPDERGGTARPARPPRAEEAAEWGERRPGRDRRAGPEEPRGPARSQRPQRGEEAPQRSEQRPGRPGAPGPKGPRGPRAESGRTERDGARPARGPGKPGPGRRR